MRENNEQSELNQLNQTLGDLNRMLNKQVSIGHNLILAIVRGLGLALGGTIVLGIAIAVLAQVLSTISSVPILENLIDQHIIEQLQQTQQ